ncbi:MAG: hypothetical protein WC054_00045 [Candidatus Nanopelagicales bacterium]
MTNTLAAQFSDFHIDALAGEYFASGSDVADDVFGLLVAVADRYVRLLEDAGCTGVMDLAMDGLRENLDMAREPAV